MRQTLWAAAVAETPEIVRQLPFKAAHTRLCKDIWESLVKRICFIFFYFLTFNCRLCLFRRENEEQLQEPDVQT